MSMIASFFLVRNSDCGKIIEAARAQSEAIRKNRGRPPDPDPFWEFMRLQTKELEDFPLNGNVLTDIFLMGQELFNAGGDLSKTLSEITGSDFVFYDPQEAADAIRIIDALDLRDAAVEQYLKEGGWPHTEDAGAAYRDAAAHFRSWLAAVKDGYTGLLSIG